MGKRKVGLQVTSRGRPTCGLRLDLGGYFINGNAAHEDSRLSRYMKVRL